MDMLVRHNGLGSEWSALAANLCPPASAYLGVMFRGVTSKSCTRDNLQGATILFLVLSDPFDTQDLSRKWSSFLLKEKSN
jgi:hypothetical protein